MKKMFYLLITVFILISVFEACEGPVGPKGEQGEVGEQGSTGSIFWQGEYSPTITYVIGDAVSYQGSAYIAIDSTLDNEPLDNSFWDILAEKGDAGECSSGTITGYLTIDSDGNYAGGEAVLLIDNTGQETDAAAILTRGNIAILADEASGGSPTLAMGRGINELRLIEENGNLKITVPRMIAPGNIVFDVIACLNRSGYWTEGGDCP